MRALAIDIGTGTQDILLWDTETPVANAIQLVMPSPTMRVASLVRGATERGLPIALSGTIMGGGPCHWAVENHRKAGYPVWATAQAARTFNDDLAVVQEELGVEIVGDEEIATLHVAEEIILRDLDIDAIRTACAAFGVGLDYDVLAVAVFDHGNAPPGVSDRRFRFDYLANRLTNGGWLTDLGFERDEIPTEMTRLAAVATTSPDDARLLVMDTAPAAILGALDDPRLRTADELIIANIGNFHALAFHLAGHTIRGLFEHHTGELTPPQLMRFIDRLGRAEITNDEVFSSQGHGALILDPTPAVQPLFTTTGPRQALLNSVAQPYHAVPHGAMMQAGCFGLLRAAAAHMPDFCEAIRAGLNDDL